MKSTWSNPQPLTVHSLAPKFVWGAILVGGLWYLARAMKKSDPLSPLPEEPAPEKPESP